MQGAQAPIVERCWRCLTNLWWQVFSELCYFVSLT